MERLVLFPIFDNLGLHMFKLDFQQGKTIPVLN
jgi:hypothetical protein